MVDLNIPGSRWTSDPGRTTEIRMALRRSRHHLVHFHQSARCTTVLPARRGRISGKTSWPRSLRKHDPRLNPILDGCCASFRNRRNQAMPEQHCRLLIVDDSLEDRTVMRLLLEDSPGTHLEFYRRRERRRRPQPPRNRRRRLHSPRLPATRNERPALPARAHPPFRPAPFPRRHVHRLRTRLHRS